MGGAVNETDGVPKQNKTNSRQHRDGTVGNRADQVDRETLVKPSPPLEMDDLSRRAHDTRALTRGAGWQQQPALRLQARPHHLVRVCGHRRGHLCDRGAEEDGMDGQRLIEAMAFCVQPEEGIRKA